MHFFHLLIAMVIWQSANFHSNAEATPLLALKEAENCGGCHKPGRSQKPFLQRRCTLDCQGCHIDPSGAGARSQWGYYYTQAKDGVAAFNFFDPQDPLQDTSRVDIHSDSRVIHRQVAGDQRTFPMSSEFSLRVRPFVEYLHLIYTASFLGRINDKSYRMVQQGDRQYREKYAVLIDQIPLNTYIKAYRGTPMYGQRRPNHSLWIRERIGQDQFAATDAIEVGTAPNVPYFHASYMTGNPYVDQELRQKGYSYHAGLRGVTLGWHLNVSGWQTKSDLAKINMQAVGAGFNAFGIIAYAERNIRKVDEEEEEEEEEAANTPPEGGENGLPIRTHPSSVINEYTVAIAMIPGVMFGGVYETLKDDTLDSQRKSLFLDLHPIPNLQLEYWRRFETGSAVMADSLFLAHLYGDF